MQGQGLDDGVVRLREWADDDAAWYAGCVRDPMIQRFTTEPPELEAGQVLAAIVRLRAAGDAEGFVICDAVTGERLGNIALCHDGHAGEVSYWVAAGARGRGVAARALALFSSWSFREVGLQELWLCAHRENAASQRAALRAGYRRDRGRDESREVKGAVWPMLGYALRQALDLTARSACAHPAGYAARQPTPETDPICARPPSMYASVLPIAIWHSTQINRICAAAVTFCPITAGMPAAPGRLCPVNSDVPG